MFFLLLPGKLLFESENWTTLIMYSAVSGFFLFSIGGVACYIYAVKFNEKRENILRKLNIEKINPIGLNLKSERRGDFLLIQEYFGQNNGLEYPQNDSSYMDSTEEYAQPINDVSYAKIT